MKPNTYQNVAQTVRMLNDITRPNANSFQIMDAMMMHARRHHNGNRANSDCKRERRHVFENVVGLSYSNGLHMAQIDELLSFLASIHLHGSKNQPGADSIVKMTNALSV